MTTYTPACIYALPEFLAERVRNQGVSVTETILTDMVAAHAGDSDQTIHDFYDYHLTAIHDAVVAGQGG